MGTWTSHGEHSVCKLGQPQNAGCHFLQQPQVQAPAATALIVPMGDQGGEPSQVQGSSVPIALRPDFTYFRQMTDLANELKSADAKVDPQVQMAATYAEP